LITNVDLLLTKTAVMQYYTDILVRVVLVAFTKNTLIYVVQV